MPATQFDKESIKNTIVGKIQRYNGLTINEASKAQIYRAVASTVRDQIMQKVMISREARRKQKGKRLEKEKAKVVEQNKKMKELL